jgi:acetoin utilization deacetylase AcuC-like enzyme
MKAYYSDTFELPLPPGHRFPAAKYRRLRQRLETVAASWGIELAEAPAAQDGELALAHAREYLARVRTGELSSIEQRRIGFPWSPKLVERCHRSTGGTIAAARAALTEGVGVHLAGGTHHAFHDAGQGFCVFNDVAVAAHVLLAERKVRRVVVVDCDVHQGNGTAAIFRDDERVFTFSMHGARNFPFRKCDGDLDIALPDGTDDAAYLSALEKAMGRDLPLARADCVFYLAGADPYQGDRYGRLKLTKSGLARRDQLVLDACLTQRLPVVVVMAGGYAADIDDIVDIHRRTVAVAAGRELCE